MRRILLAVFLLASLVPAQSAPSANLDDRRKAFSALLDQYWDALLDHSPEFASEIGDTRFNDKLSDYSPRAQNLWTAREQDFLMKLAAIDPAGFPPLETRTREDLLTQLANDIDAAGDSRWQTPITADSDVFTQYPDLDEQLSFATVKDYDDWIARLRSLSDAVDQGIANMGAGIDAHHVPERLALQEALDDLRPIAAQKPEDSDFARPLKQFPASIPAAEQQRIQTETLAVISKQVLPAYQRLIRFIEVSYIPAASNPPAPSSSGAQSFTLQSRQVHILTLRDKAKEALGAKFDLKAFHEFVAANALLPLDTLQERGKAWLAGQVSSQSKPK